MSLDDHVLVDNSLTMPALNESSNLESKELWVSPKIELICELKILNNSSGGGDGDAALAHS